MANSGRKRERTMDGDDDDDCKALMQETESRIKCAKELKMDSNEVMADEEWTPPSEAEMKVIEARRERQDKISKIMGGYLLKGYKMLATTCPKCTTILMRRKGELPGSEGADYCIACNELESDTTKDDPVLNCLAAQRQVLERHMASTSGHTTTSPVAVAHQTAASPAVASPAAASPASAGIFPETSHHGSDWILCGNPNAMATQTANQMAFGSLRRPSSPKTYSNTSSSSASSSACAKIKPMELSSHAGEITAATPVDYQLMDSSHAVMEKLEWATASLRQTHNVETSSQLCSLIKVCADTIVALKSAGGDDQVAGGRVRSTSVGSVGEPTTSTSSKKA